MGWGTLRWVQRRGMDFRPAMMAPASSASNWNSGMAGKRQSASFRRMRIFVFRGLLWRRAGKPAPSLHRRHDVLHPLGELLRRVIAPPAAAAVQLGKIGETALGQLKPFAR